MDEFYNNKEIEDSIYNNEVSLIKKIIKNNYRSNNSLKTIRNFDFIKNKMNSISKKNIHFDNLNPNEIINSFKNLNTKTSKKLEIIKNIKIEKLKDHLDEKIIFKEKRRKEKNINVKNTIIKFSYKNVINKQNDENTKKNINNIENNNNEIDNNDAINKIKNRIKSFSEFVNIINKNKLNINFNDNLNNLKEKKKYKNDKTFNKNKNKNKKKISNLQNNFQNNCNISDDYIFTLNHNLKKTKILKQCKYKFINN